MKSKNKEKQVLVIEDVEFYEYDLSAIPMSEKFDDWLTLLDKPKMKMTLEWESEWIVMYVIQNVLEKLLMLGLGKYTPLGLAPIVDGIKGMR